MWFLNLKTLVSVLMKAKQRLIYLKRFVCSDWTLRPEEGRKPYVLTLTNLFLGAYSKFLSWTAHILAFSV
jgi:hypothetical protein